MSFPDEGDAGLTSTRLAFETALALILARDVGGVAEAQRRLDAARANIGLALGQQPDAGSDDTNGAASVRSLDQARAALLYRAEQALAGMAPPSWQSIKALCENEAAALSVGRQAALQEAADTEIDGPKLERYLRDRTGDPALDLAEFKPLMGGFGKETYLFRASGRELDGEFVIRRDQPAELVPGACHKVSHEFEVVKAVWEAGFPAPEALWLERNSSLLPGADFIVMRRSAGAPAGTLVGATGETDPTLNDQLGETMGRLHSLPPLMDLGDLTESIRRDQWHWPAEKVLRTYIDDMRGMLLNLPHAPSLATVAAWNWLAENMPDDLGSPCLIHGDIGFHNMLLTDGRLSCLLDWENTQIGHPGMDLGYVFNAAGATLDWPRVMRAYAAAGGTPLNERQLLYFRIMMLVRIATTVNVGPSHLFCGEVLNLRLLNAEVQFRPPVLQRMAQLIEQYASMISTGSGD